MKIVEATVEHTGRAYKATVVVLDEGKRYTGVEAGCDNPYSAVHAAASHAAAEIRKELLSTLSVKTEVTF